VQEGRRLASLLLREEPSPGRVTLYSTLCGQEEDLAGAMQSELARKLGAGAVALCQLSDASHPSCSVATDWILDLPTRPEPERPPLAALLCGVCDRLIAVRCQGTNGPTNDASGVLEQIGRLATGIERIDPTAPNAKSTVWLCRLPRSRS